MIIGGLSKQEIASITLLLDSENIPHQVKTDEHMVQTNNQSMKNDIRHLSAPSISTHILAIEINEEDFGKMSSSLKSKLLDYGITDQVPEGLEFSEEEPKMAHQQLSQSNNRIIAFNAKHQIILGVIIFICFLFYKYLG